MHHTKFSRKFNKGTSSYYPEIVEEFDKTESGFTYQKKSYYAPYKSRLRSKVCQHDVW